MFLSLGIAHSQGPDTALVSRLPLLAFSHGFEGPAEDRRPVGAKSRASEWLRPTASVLLRGSDEV